MCFSAELELPEKFARLALIRYPGQFFLKSASTRDMQIGFGSETKVLRLTGIGTRTFLNRSESVSIKSDKLYFQICYFNMYTSLDSILRKIVPRLVRKKKLTFLRSACSYIKFIQGHLYLFFMDSRSMSS